MREAGYRHMVGIGDSFTSADDPRLVFFSVKEGTAKIADIDGSEREIALP